MITSFTARSFPVAGFPSIGGDGSEKCAVSTLLIADWRLSDWLLIADLGIVGMDCD
jgi:hypothetical protein